MYKTLEVLVPLTIVRGSDSNHVYVSANYMKQILTIVAKIFVTPVVLSSFVKTVQYIAQKTGEEFKKDSLFTPSVFFKCSAVALVTIQLYEMIEGQRNRSEFPKGKQVPIEDSWYSIL